MTNEQFITKVLSIAKIGLKYSKDEYAIENYAELQKLGIKMLSQVSNKEVNSNIFVRDVYPTPNISVRIIITNDKDQVLFVKEKVEAKWGVPGGWCDLFISPKANAKKEVFEETGLEVEILDLLAVFNRELYRTPKTILSDYVMYFNAKIINSSKLDIGFEVSEAKYYNMDALPILSTNNTKKELAIVWDVLKNNKKVFVD
ncbi:MAG: NUDIX domain-containing protein [Erysipelothrix sp.]|nr:NUDIX domain-containing protein [Erysipelothrix sp.]